MSACTNATNHNIKSKPNLFNALTSKGMSWRVYSESKNPGADWRKDGTADATIVAPDYLYTASEPVGAIGTPGLQVRLASALYAAKHNGSVFFQNVRSSPEFLQNNRTLGGANGTPRWRRWRRPAGTPTSSATICKAATSARSTSWNRTSATTCTA